MNIKRDYDLFVRRVPRIVPGYSAQLRLPLRPMAVPPDPNGSSPSKIERTPEPTQNALDRVVSARDVHWVEAVVPVLSVLMFLDARDHEGYFLKLPALRILTDDGWGQRDR